MKKKIIIAWIIAAIFLLGTISFMVIGILSSTTLSETIINRYNREYGYMAGDTNWFVKINGKYKISPSTAERDKQILYSWLFTPYERKIRLKDKKTNARYLENVLHQNLLIIEAIDKGMVDTDEFNQYVWIAIRDAISKYYIKKRIEAKNPNYLFVDVTDEEAMKVYNKHKNLYTQLGLSKEDAILNIKSSIRNEKLSQRLKIYEQKIISQAKLKNNIEIAGQK